MRRDVACALALAAGGAACSAAEKPPSGSVTVTGTIHGTVVPSADETALLGPVPVQGSSSPLDALYVVVSNRSGLCSILTRNANPPSSSALEIAIVSLANIVPKTYPIGAPNPDFDEVRLDFLVDDATCAAIANRSAHAVTGTITVTAITPTDVLGAFDVDLDSNDHVTGSFTAPLCGADVAAVLGASAAPVCGG